MRHAPVPVLCPGGQCVLLGTCLLRNERWYKLVSLTHNIEITLIKLGQNNADGYQSKIGYWSHKHQSNIKHSSDMHQSNMEHSNYMHHSNMER